MKSGEGRKQAGSDGANRRIGSTIDDGARTASLGHLTFPPVCRWVEDIITVTDDDLVHAMRFVWTKTKLIVEPTGALGFAAVFNHRYDVEGKKVVVIISGGNVDIAAAADWFGRITG